MSSGPDIPAWCRPCEAEDSQSLSGTLGGHAQMRSKLLMPMQPMRANVLATCWPQGEPLKNVSHTRTTKKRASCNWYKNMSSIRRTAQPSDIARIKGRYFFVSQFCFCAGGHTTGEVFNKRDGARASRSALYRLMVSEWGAEFYYSADRQCACWHQSGNSNPTWGISLSRLLSFSQGTPGMIGLSYPARAHMCGNIRLAPDLRNRHQFLSTAVVWRSHSVFI